MRILGRLIVTIVMAAAGLAAAVVLVTRPARAVLTAGQTEKAPPDVDPQQLSQRSVVYDRHGGLLAVLHAEENRSPVTLDHIPAHVVDAILDVEDEHFWTHGGVNVRSILRAAFANVQSGEVRQGGSTITQQLVKNSLLTPERDLSRKVKEAVLAVRVEDNMTKREILEQYLNTVYFGNGAYGVQAAAETYYDIPATELDVAQAAFLAGVIRNPLGYDPFKNPEESLARRNFALERMVEAGHLDRHEADELKRTPLPRQRVLIETKEDYFVEEVKQRLLKDPRLGETAQERYNAVFRGGLRIETTFDPALQRVADEKVKALLPDTKGRFTAALVSLEPSTGAVRAMVAGPGYEQSKFNLVTQARRQPGSSFKMFVLMTALEAGYGPNDTVNGTNGCRFKLKGMTEPYTPENYEGSRGSVGPIANATARSLNCAFARLALSLDSDPWKSLEKVAQMAKRMGIKGKIEPYPAMALGSEEVTPLEMASAYAVLASDGVRHEPYFIERVIDQNGKVVFSGRTKGQEVVSAQHARMATQVLRKVVESGTGTRARLPGREVAGKTGTSQEWRDAWFIGYTPQLATAVWMGSPVGQVPMRNVGGIRVVGGSYPARMWAAFMSEALAGQPALAFPAPDPRQIPKGKAVKGTFAGSGKDSKGSDGKDKSRTKSRPKRPPPARAPARSPATGDDGGGDDDRAREAGDNTGENAEENVESPRAPAGSSWQP